MNDSALFWLLWFPVMALVMGYLAKARLQRPKSLEAGEVRHPWTMLAVFVGGFVLVFGLALAILLSDDDGTTSLREQVVTSCGLLGFALLFAIGIVETQRCRHFVSSEGIKYQPLFRRGGFLKWSDVRSVRYSLASKWFRLDGANGEVVRVSAFMINLPQFAARLLARVPSDAIVPPADHLLYETQAGNPPSIW